MTNLRFSSALVLSSALLSSLLTGCMMPIGETQVTVRGAGHVTSNPEGIACASDSAEEACFAELGRTFTLTAKASANAHFDHWEGDELCVASKQATVAIALAPDRKIECIAVFADGPSQGNPL